jgi:subtilisin family serine protease
MLARALTIAAITLGASAAPAAAASPLLQWALGPLHAATAWQQSTGGGALVAMIDTGVALQRPELAGNLWTNPGEIPGNGVDDDGDGIVDDVHGADFVNGDGNPADDNGHGTHVAGIIASHGALKGLAPGAMIMPVKVLGRDRSGNAHLLAQGIEYAIAHGARILNVSVNGDGTSDELEAAIRDAQNAGAVIVASAGNDGRNLDARPSYPVSDSDPAVVGVAAASSSGRRASFSNYGSGVDVTAPGEGILSLGLPGFAYRSGTSMAAAYVSATLALEAAAAPALSMPILRDVLLRTEGAGGMLDPAAAVRTAAAAGAPATTAAAKPKAKAKRRHHRSKKRHHRRHHARRHATRAHA